MIWRVAKILLGTVLFVAACYATAYVTSYLTAKYSKPRYNLYAI